MNHKLNITALLLLAALPVVGQGTWDKAKWPKAEPYRENLAEDFTWKPGPSNQPEGVARGIFPGRVVMTRDPEAARWPGRWNVEEDQWFLDKYTDADRCEKMLSTAIQCLTGAKNDKKAWQKAFLFHNREVRGLKKGYSKGEVVAVKINLNNSSSNKRDNQSDATPQMTLAVVRGLVKAGVPQQDIIIYDVKRQIYAQLLSRIWQEYPDVRFVQDGEARRDQPLNPKYGTHQGIEAAEWVEGIEYTSGHFNEAKLIARQVKDATYIVNLAMLKLHSYPYNYMEDGDNGQTAITMSSKNHAGSIKGTPELHQWINSTDIHRRQHVEHGYNPLVDLEASPNLGRKTLLYLLDGLYCGRKWRTYPLHFPNAPFFNKTEPYENPEWPACLLASFDPVALQSVGLDIMYAQSLNNREPGYYNVPRIMLRDMADDILHEMATPDKTPSGTVYMQEGKPIPSLGVFEHWNNPEQMQYSRNLDPKHGKGIEFIYIGPNGNGGSSMVNGQWSIVPSTPSEAPDYFCTWNSQGYLASYTSTEDLRRMMTEKSLFGHDAFERWVGFYPQVRGDLYFVLDDSWDIPADANYKNDNPYIGMLELDTSRFPSFKGNPEQRMRQLADSIEANGWKGLGLWVSPQKAPKLAQMDEETFWENRLKTAEAARVRYWKVDWGQRDRDDNFRRDIAEKARTLAPHLVLENALKGEYVQFSDAFRTYDVENIISQPVTIQRVWELLSFKARDGAKGIINCEDEPYIAAGMGCAIGVMRHPYVGTLPNGRKDHVFPETVRDLKRRLDEVVRAVRWHRIAMPFGVDGNVQTDTARLHDYWTYQQEESWMQRKDGEHVKGDAPSRISRGMPLPVVESTDAERPFVLASRYPNGATAVATIGRTIDRRYVSLPVNISFEAGRFDAPIGLFGVMGDVTIHFPTLPDKFRLYAQDLKADKAEDITKKVSRKGSSITLPAALLKRIGLSAAAPGDKSDPALVLQVVTKK